MTERTTSLPKPALMLRHCLAAVGVALVLMLGTATVTPALHHWLHVDDGHEEADHQCAVVLFASGVTLAAASVALSGSTLAWRAFSPSAFAELLLASPRYLRQPERGPPVG